jgi:hypothetical protein
MDRRLTRPVSRGLGAAAAMLALAASLAGCNAIRQPATMISAWTNNWRSVVTPADRARLRDWRAAFADGLAAARKSGHAADIAREGALLEPDAAIGGPIANGDYTCRITKLGAKGSGLLDYVAYPAFRCRVTADRDLQRLAKIGGSQRVVGLIFPADAMRQVLLGTLVLGDERRALQYGQDATRDVAGYIERIGPARWRLIMPRPHFESQLDVMELVPAREGIGR